jgi:hypothetical protein
LNTEISIAWENLRLGMCDAILSNAVSFTLLAFSFFKGAHTSSDHYVEESSLPLRIVFERKLGFGCTFGIRVDLSMFMSHFRSYIRKMPVETEETILGCLQ